MAKKLNEKQKKFLEVLFAEAKGNFLEAKRLAGYSENTATSEVVEVLREEIVDKTHEFLGTSSAKAAYTMYDILENPTELGNRERMNAAKDILDRAGYKPKEKVEVSAPDPIFILPPKADE